MSTTDIVDHHDQFRRHDIESVLIVVTIPSRAFVFSTPGVKIMTHITAGPFVDLDDRGPAGSKTHWGGLIWLPLAH
ncbi:hypothetical protein [Brevibacterium limosum]|uniref:hypothetical protein n=1 Tax=Brevibacterium limosum TaxID=2697565 RepID=UPI00141DD16E|nr:hypothetical protein [Brevibacterium limosum]